MTANRQFSEISISYSPKLKPSEMPIIKTSQDAEKYFRGIWSERMSHIEQVYMLLLNRANRVIGFLEVSRGGTSGTVVDPKIIFQAALKANAHAIILAHNHPSGCLRPSDTDIRLTQQLKSCGLMLELPLLDHLIITQEGFYRFTDEGVCLNPI